MSTMKMQKLNVATPKNFSFQTEYMTEKQKNGMLPGKKDMKDYMTEGKKKENILFGQQPGFPYSSSTCNYCQTGIIVKR